MNMRHSWRFATCVVVLLLYVCTTAWSQTVWLTVAYCPTDFTSAGAVVAVDANTGNYTIVGKFLWPKGLLFGCAALYDPVVDMDSSTGLLYMDFGEDLGTLATVNVSAAKPVRETLPHDEFFVGFTNMKFDATQGRIVGLSPTGTRDGEGAFEYGSLDPSSVDGAYRAIAQIPFRAMMDDTDYLDTNGSRYWVQASYDKRPQAQQCDPTNDAALCLLSIDSHSGALLSAVHTNWTVYKFADTPNADGSVLAFIEGFASLCKHPGLGDFVFGNVELASATVQPLACLPANVTIQTAQWISSFSADLTQWATASAFGSELQFLSFRTKDGSLLAQSTLPGLAKELGAAEGLVFVWAVDYAPPTAVPLEQPYRWQL